MRDLLTLLLEAYEIRQVAQFYIATLKVKSILLPKFGDIKATKLSSARIKEYVAGRLKVCEAGYQSIENLGCCTERFNSDSTRTRRSLPVFPIFRDSLRTAQERDFSSRNRIRSYSSNSRRNFDCCLLWRTMSGCVRVPF